MDTVTEKAYTFAELSDDAKEQALEGMRTFANEIMDYDFCIEHIKEMGNVLGIEIDHVYFSGFYNQGDGAMFTGEYSYKQNSVKAIKELSFDSDLRDVAVNLANTQQKNFYGLSATVSHIGRNYHEQSTSIDVYNDRLEREASESVTDDISEYLRDFMLWSYSILKQEYEFQLLDSTLIDSIDANDMRFDENGN
ncbi:MAG: hypothetical protein GQ468_02895 [Candidatus Scalindua sp.]|nr:hypothetical protein [Candidatus Scalindua sp.]